MQMLDVALSRRMCCSRVWSASRSAGRPSASSGQTDQAARHLAPVLVTTGEEAGVRSPVAHGNAEALGRAHGDVGAHLARRAEDGEREEIGRDDDEGPRGACACGEGREVRDTSIGGRVLDEHAEVAPARRGRPSRRRRPRPRSRAARRASSRRRWSAGGSRRRRRRPCGSSWRRAWHMAMASAAAVRLVEERGVGERQAVRSATMVWKLSSASSRPCEISAW